MPSLYGFTGNNSNVSVGNTTGLYIGSGNVNILNNAGTLLSLLSNAGTVGFTLTNTGTQVEGFVLPSGVTAATYGNASYFPTFTVGSDGRLTAVSLNSVAAVANSYGNANVAAYLPTDATIQSLQANSVSLFGNAQAQESEITSLRANITAANLNIQTISANLGSFQTYAKVTYATNANLASTNANLAAFETYANATFGTSSYGNSNVAVYLAANTDPTISNLNANTHQVQTQIASINSNVTAANASIQTLNANVGSFYTYANLTYSTISNAASQESEITSLRANITAANLNIQTLSANLGSFETYANATFVTTANASTYSNTNVSAYLSSGLVSNINTSGNITTTANVVASGNFYGNLIGYSCTFEFITITFFLFVNF